MKNSVFNEDEESTYQGIQKYKLDEFVGYFCSTQISLERTLYKKPLLALFSKLKDKGCTRIFVGGSFVTKKEKPTDIDCIALMPEVQLIPSEQFALNFSKGITDEIVEIDLIYISENSKETIYSLLNFFSKDKKNQNQRIVEINLQEIENRHDFTDFGKKFDKDNYESLKFAYGTRASLKKIKKEMVVTIHGINTNAIWNNQLAPIVSNADYIFCPYSFGKKIKPLFFNSYSKKELAKFRSWINQTSNRYETRINVFAHSYGTYLLCRYIKENNYNPPVKFKTIILSGSIVNTDFDWEEAYKNDTFKSLINITSPNDQWVKRIEFVNILKRDPLYGKAGIEGFDSSVDYIKNNELSIFDHNNIMMTESFENFILPALSYEKAIEKKNKHDYIYNDFV